VKKFLSGLLRLYVYWLLLFVAGKALFLLYQHQKAATLSVSEVARVFFYGLRLDASAAGYFSLFPFLVLGLAAFFPKGFTRKLVNGYMAIFTVLVSLLQTVDLQLYSVWGFKLDATPLQYINTPAEMAASSASAPLLLLSVIFMAQAGLFLFLYFQFFQPKQLPVLKKLEALAPLIVLILPIRGGWQQIPINQSVVYFSEKHFANHAAVNVTWNVLYSLNKISYAGKNPYDYLPEKDAAKTVATFYQPADTISENILKVKRPNILFVILESYTAKFMGCLGGEKGVTPELDKIAREGMLFTQFYANGDRSEKGLVSILSGYPTQTTTSIIKTPRKTEKLPHFTQTLKNAGYATAYYYGGDLSFANIRSYVLTAGFEKQISKSDFPAKDYNSKWGVHDHVLLNKVLHDLGQAKSPFFTTVFTLSSHEPYDVPMKTRFRGEDDTTKFRNSVYYTDMAVGNFMKEAKKQAWWDNTLVVLVADHGHAYPKNDAQDAIGKFKIPLILTGGALAKNHSVNATVASQTDLAYSVLNQLNLPNQDFKWSKDLFNPQAKPFAFYIFNDGFGFITDKGNYSFDNISRKVIRQEGTVTPQDIKAGKAFMQVSFGDYLKK
jgi:phosphoglycerol transferase MdoB-like AlkP superfamily enzyme